jgi:hypothetical protein
MARGHRDLRRYAPRSRLRPWRLDPGFVSSLRHYADHGVTVAFQINSDAGVVDDSSDLVPALEAALADLAIDGGR